MLYIWFLDHCKNKAVTPHCVHTNTNASKTTAIIEDDYEAHLEEWESIQSKILSCFINTFVPSIHSLFLRLGTMDTTKMLEVAT